MAGERWPIKSHSFLQHKHPKRIGEMATVALSYGNSVYPDSSSASSLDKAALPFPGSYSQPMRLYFL